MTVDRIVQQHKRAQFGEWLKSTILAAYPNQNAFAHRLFGDDDKGRPRNTGKLSRIILGHDKPSNAMLEQMAPILGVTVKELIERRDTVERRDVPAERVQQRKTGEQFSLVIDQAGNATLRLNLVDVPMDVALRAMHALTGAGLLGHE